MSIEIRGIPRSLARDAWWLSGPADAGRGAAQPRARKGLWIVTILVVAWDVILWDGAGALPLLMFSALWGGALMWLYPMPRRRMMQIAGVLLATGLPLFEYLQALSVLWWIAGLVVATALAVRVPLTNIWVWALRWPFLGWRGIEIPTGTGFDKAVLRHAVLWAPAVAFGGIFVLLFWQANPIFSTLAGGIAVPDLNPGRAVFWVFLLILAGLLCVARHVPNTAMKVTGPSLQKGAIIRALITFNILFLFHLISDFGAYISSDQSVKILAKSARGAAHPLVATAALAGLFMLLSRAHYGDIWVRRLQGVWIVLNVILLITAALRLAAYTDHFGWTYLRFYAAIWMGLVAFGLGTLIYDLAKRQTTGWVWGWNGAATAFTLYVICFVNVAGILAQDAQRRANAGLHHDKYYVCNAWGRAPELVAELTPLCQNARYSRPGTLQLDWRNWDYRTARLLNKIHVNKGRTE